MGQQKNILLINTGIAIAITTVLAFVTDTFPGNGFFFMFGLVGIAGGFGCLLLGLLYRLRKNKSLETDFFKSAVLLLIAGTVSYVLASGF
jgi:hypothetical protein